MLLELNKVLIIESLQLLEEWDRPIGSGLSKSVPEDLEARDRLASQIKDSRAQSSMYHDGKVVGDSGFDHHNKMMDNYKNYHNNFARLLSQKNGVVQHIDKIQQKNPEHAQKVLETLGAKPRIIPSYNSTDNAQIRSRVNAGIEPLSKLGTPNIQPPKKQA